MNFTSSNGLWLGCYFALGFSGQGIGVAEAVVPNFSLRLPWGYFFLKKFVQRVAYEKIKIEASKDVEI